VSSRRLRAIELYKSGCSTYKIARMLKASTRTVWQWVCAEGIIRPWRKGDPSKKFEPRFDEALGYVLGVVYGDGSVYVTRKYDKKRKKFYPMWMVTIGAGYDLVKTFAETLTLVIGKSRPLPLYFDKSRNVWRITAYSKPFVSWVKSLTHNKLRDFLLDNRQFAKGFLRGFFDSEGGPTIRQYMTKYGKPQIECTIQVYNTKKELLDLCKELLQKHFNIKTQKIFEGYFPSQFGGCFLSKLIIGDRKQIAQYMKEVDFSIREKNQKWRDFCRMEEFNAT
jgi:intein-encoded DNA endonuclease-like protein